MLATYLVDDPTPSARIHNTTADLSSVRITAMALILISTMAFNWIRFTSPVPISTMLYPTSDFLSAFYRSTTSRSLDLDLVSDIAVFLKLDYLSCFIASYAWLALLFKDLKAAKMVSTTWSRLVALCCCGHGSGEVGCSSRRCLALERRNSCRQENGRCSDQELNYNLLVRKRSDMECLVSCSGLETVVLSSKGHRRDRRRQWTMGSMQ